MIWAGSWKPCAPGEVHPAYAGQQWLLDWLNDPAHPYGYHVRIPIRPVLRVSDPVDVVPLDRHEHLMARRTAAGLAPYVGDPFVYVWPVGVDELGRMIGGETRIQMVGAC